MFKILNMNYRFYKDLENKWYIDLPHWTGHKDDLEMVMGADLMLDILSQGEDTIHISFNINEPDLYRIKLVSTMDGLADGMTYTSHWNNDLNVSNFEVWLCHVTKFVFGYFPNIIYIE